MQAWATSRQQSWVFGQVFQMRVHSRINCFWFFGSVGWNWRLLCVRVLICFPSKLICECPTLQWTFLNINFQTGCVDFSVQAQYGIIRNLFHPRTLFLESVPAATHFQNICGCVISLFRCALHFLIVLFISAAESDVVNETASAKVCALFSVSFLRQLQQASASQHFGVWRTCQSEHGLGNKYVTLSATVATLAARDPSLMISDQFIKFIDTFEGVQFTEKLFVCLQCHDLLFGKSEELRKLRGAKLCAFHSNTLQATPLSLLRKSDSAKKVKVAQASVSSSNLETKVTWKFGGRKLTVLTQVSSKLSNKMGESSKLISSTRKFAGMPDRAADNEEPIQPVRTTNKFKCRFILELVSIAFRKILRIPSLVRHMVVWVKWGHFSKSGFF